MVRPAFTFTSTPFTTDVIKLGTLIPDKKHPNRDAIRNGQVTENDYSTAPDRNFDAHLTASSDSRFHMMISKLFTFGVSKKSNATLQYASGEAYLYELHHPREIFRNLCLLDDTRKTLEEWNEEGREAYFIIAYRTLVDATLIDDTSRIRDANANIKVPVAALAGAGTPAGGSGDVGITAGYENEETRGEHFLCKGERVYAVCCRKVKLKLINGVVGDTRLADKDIWVPYHPTRSVGDGLSLMHAMLMEEEDPDDLSDREYVWEHADGEVFETLCSDEEDEED